LCGTVPGGRSGKGGGGGGVVWRVFLGRAPAPPVPPAQCTSVIVSPHLVWFGFGGFGDFVVADASLNGVSGCADHRSMQTVLRDTWGLKGFVVRCPYRSCVDTPPLSAHTHARSPTAACCRYLRFSSPGYHHPHGIPIPSHPMQFCRLTASLRRRFSGVGLWRGSWHAVRSDRLAHGRNRPRVQPLG